MSTAGQSEKGCRLPSHEKGGKSILIEIASGLRGVGKFMLVGDHVIETI